MMNKKSAFTLTEVLVTLSIIGVVSALTVPTLMNQYQKKTQSVQIRKSINDFVSAIDMLITEEGKTSFKATSVFTDVLPDNTSVDGIQNLIALHFKIIKTCDAKAAGCFASEKYRTIDNTSSETFQCEEKAYVLANSAAICVSKKVNSAQAQVVGRPYLVIQIDINGIEKPNMGGRDMFNFYINKEGEFDWNNPSTMCMNGPCTPSSSTCKTSSIGNNCIGVLSENNWIMDY